ncbi:MAG: hypothetical protein K9J27_08160 [Bacteroidales bacterium]|nr:hypothetical protein [Bacteroidales bacterium]MCF8334004.1 hypothetical protein [Bacteroidales bacterium]
MKTKILTVFLSIAIATLISADVNGGNQDEEEGFSTCDYAYVRVEGQIDRRMSVEVDLGESKKANNLEDQIEDELKGYHSYVQILNYFLDRDYKLKKVFDQMFMSASGGGSEGIAYLFLRPGAEE